MTLRESPCTAPWRPAIVCVPPALRRRSALAPGVGAWLFGALFMAYHLNRGWVAHDDGAFAQSAATRP